MRRTPPKEIFWISLSDIMTALMVIFLFISITYIYQQQKQEKVKDDLVKDFQNTKVDLYRKLRREFEQDFRVTKWNAELDSNDLSIRFLNENVLFAEGQDTLKPGFKAILADFFPRYLSILLDTAFKSQILEVRIEGHTNTNGTYMDNVGLSQRRTQHVLDFILNNPRSTFPALPMEDQKLVRYWLMANGLSYGRTIDADRRYTLVSGKPEDKDKSKRVEFRIVTKTEEVLQELLDKIAKKP